MQLLLIHSDFIEFEAKRPTKMAEEIDDQAKKGRLEEALCAFIAVEKFDEDDPDAVVAASAGGVTLGAAAAAGAAAGVPAGC